MTPYLCLECGSQRTAVEAAIFKICNRCQERNYGLNLRGRQPDSIFKLRREMYVHLRKNAVKAYPSLRKKDKISAYCARKGISRDALYRWVRAAGEGQEQGFKGV